MVYFNRLTSLGTGSFLLKAKAGIYSSAQCSPSTVSFVSGYPAFISISNIPDKWVAGSNFPAFNVSVIDISGNVVDGAISQIWFYTEANCTVKQTTYQEIQRL